MSKLSTCHEDLQKIFYEVVRTFDCAILQGYRNEEDQNTDFSSGKSKLQWPNSKHNTKPSLAVDVSPYPIPNWNDTKDFVYFAGYVMGTAAKLFADGKIGHMPVWGGDWNNNKRTGDEDFCDYTHFQLDL